MNTEAKIHIIVLGGTITMTQQEGAGVVPTLDGASLLNFTPKLAAFSAITVETPFLVPSGSLSFQNISTLIELVKSAIRSGAEGIVIVQGTDTIDEMAFILHCTVATDIPIVFTGAMRNPTVAGADGPANVWSSILVASSPGANGQGVLAVLNDEVHSACYVEKSHTSSCSAFSSPSIGRVGEIVEERLRIHWLLPASRRYLSPSMIRAKFSKVAIVKLALGEDSLQSVELDKYEGVVIEGMGGGHVPSTLSDQIEEIAKKVPVVLGTRVVGGPVLTSTYGSVGSEIDLISRGLIPAGILSPHKARLLLSLLVGGGAARSEMIDAFSSFS